MKHYTSIDDLPVGIFNKVLETGDHKLLLIEKGMGLRRSMGAKRLAKLWNDIFAEHIDTFGVPEHYTKYLECMARAISYYDKAYNEGKRWMLTLGDVKKLEAQEHMKGAVKQDFDILVAQVSKFMCFPIRPHIDSTRQFYSYLKMAQGNG